MLFASEATLEALIGRLLTRLGLGEGSASESSKHLASAEQHLKRSLQLRGTVAAPDDVKPPEWPGPLQDLARIAGYRCDLAAMRAFRERGLQQCRSNEGARSIRIDSAVSCGLAIERIREEAQQMLRDNPVLRAARSAADVPSDVRAKMEASQQQIIELCCECCPNCSVCRRCLHLHVFACAGARVVVHVRCEL